MPYAKDITTELNAQQQALAPKSESEFTTKLKWAAWRWLREVAQCKAIGFEVKLEGPSGRVIDLVGIGPDNLVYIVEVKASRADLRRDDKTKHDKARFRAEHSALADAAELTATILADARRVATAGATPGTDWREAAPYREAKREHTAAQERLDRRSRSLKSFSTKFHDPRFMACADYHCIMAPAGLISLSELPPYWGLLDQDGNSVVMPTPKQVRRNTTHVLRAIAKANTRDIRKLCLGSTEEVPETPDEEDMG